MRLITPPQIMGDEFTSDYSRRRGRPARPSDTRLTPLLAEYCYTVGTVPLRRRARVRDAVAAAVGADAVVHPDELAERRAQLLPYGADVIVDAVGSQFATAVEHAALGGRIVLFGMNDTARPAIHQYTITHRSLSVLGAYVTAFTFPTAIRLVEGGSLPLDPIVTHVLPLDRVSEGLDLLRSGGATKVVITPGVPPAS